MTISNNKDGGESRKMLTKVFTQLDSGGYACEIAISARIGTIENKSGVIFELLSGRKLFIQTTNCRQIIREMYSSDMLEITGNESESCIYIP